MNLLPSGMVTEPVTSIFFIFTCTLERCSIQNALLDKSIVTGVEKILSVNYRV